MKTVIGIDYGTLSARGVLINTENGETLLKKSINYPHGVMEGALASSEDYLTILDELMTYLSDEKYRDTVKGICVDATSLTLVCVDENGTVLADLPEFKGREQAQIKLWKRHTAESQAQEALSLAKEMDEQFIKRTGGTISSEWTIPKILEIRDEDKEVYGKIDLAFDLCDFLTYKLTGLNKRSVGAMSYKSSYFLDIGFPSDSYLNSLRQGFAEEYKKFLRGDVISYGEKAGYLKEDLCEKYGLNRDTVVASGVIDGHTSLIALGALKEGDGTLVVGTSNVLSLESKEMHEIEGICGIAEGGYNKGKFGIEAGQNCTGDMLQWYMENALPEEVKNKAVNKGVTTHKILRDKIRNPWENRMVATDFFNGSRNAPCDLSLRASIFGLSIETKPEDIYLTLLQSIVCGTRELVELIKKEGVKIERIYATGGIAYKDPFLMQQYAEILNLPIYVGRVSEGPAVGTSIYAAVASGIYESPEKAFEKMGVKEFTEYHPTPDHREEYENLFRRSHLFREMIIKMNKI